MNFCLAFIFIHLQLDVHELHMVEEDHWRLLAVMNTVRVTVLVGIDVRDYCLFLEMPQELGEQKMS